MARKKKPKARHAKRHVRHHKAGTPPGQLVAHPDAQSAELYSLRFNERELDEAANPPLTELAPRPDSVLWVNVHGLGDVPLLQGLGERFSLHPLALEDVVNVGQRQKVDEYLDHLFIVLRMPHFTQGQFSSEQVSLFLSQQFLLTFQEQAGDCFDPVRDRLRQGRVRIRSSGADYLAYAVLDAIVDGYFPVVEYFGERLQHFEDQLVEHTENVAIGDLYQLKRDITTVRNLIRPLVDLTSILVRVDTQIIAESTRFFLRDCHDHALRLLDEANEHRDTAAGLIELHRSNVTDRTNDVMRLLTVIATIFIPMTFIAGVYGMNFDPGASRWNMPELSWPLGYPLAMGAMALVAVVMLMFFHRKGWLK